MSIVELDTDKFEEKISESSDTALVDFWADWCGPCKQLEPRLAELAKEYDGDVNFYRVDVDENQELAGQFGIRSIPTLLIFDAGEKVGEIVGSVPKDSICQELEPHL